MAMTTVLELLRMDSMCTRRSRGETVVESSRDKEFCVRSTKKMWVRPSADEEQATAAVRDESGEDKEGG